MPGRKGGSMSGLTTQTKGKLQQWKGRAKGRLARMRHDKVKAAQADMERLVGTIKVQAGRTERVLEKELERIRKD